MLMLVNYYLKNGDYKSPLSFNIGETFITPEYDPFYQDILLQDRLDASKEVLKETQLTNKQLIIPKEKASV